MRRYSTPHEAGWHIDAEKRGGVHPIIPADRYAAAELIRSSYQMDTAALRRLDAPRRLQTDARAAAAKFRRPEAVAADQAPAQMPALQTAACFGAHEIASNAPILRAALLVGAAAAAVVAWLAASGTAPAGEPEWVVLLRGMAAIKGLLALSAAGLVWWRVGQPVSLRVATTYIGCACALVFSTVLIWHLAFILAAAVLFHAAGLVGLILALREGRDGPLRAHAPHPAIARTL